MHVSAKFLVITTAVWAARAPNVARRSMVSHMTSSALDNGDDNGPAVDDSAAAASSPSSSSSSSSSSSFAMPFATDIKIESREILLDEEPITLADVVEVLDSVVRVLSELEHLAEEMSALEKIVLGEWEAIEERNRRFFLVLALADENQGEAAVVAEFRNILRWARDFRDHRALAIDARVGAIDAREKIIGSELEEFARVVAWVAREGPELLETETDTGISEIHSGWIEIADRWKVVRAVWKDVRDRHHDLLSYEDLGYGYGETLEL